MPRGVYQRKKKPVEDRFCKYVNKDTESGCWEWQGSMNNRGYGHFLIDGKMILAHRYSYELHKDPIPMGMCILHACDNRRCVNPDHLSIGSHLDNYQDMVNKKRDKKAQGSLHGSSKLTEEQVLIIKNKLILGEKNTHIAKEFDVCKQAISDIKTGRSWSHVKIN